MRVSGIIVQFVSVIAAISIITANAFNSPPLDSRSSPTTTTINTNNNINNKHIISSNRNSKTLLNQSLNHKHKINNPTHQNKPKQKCHPCPEPNNDNIDLDRREAAFAMLGTLWSVGILPEQALAAYGEDAKMEIPNVADGLNNRVNKQCLVESLGNRDCLVYLDPEKKLYKTPNVELLVERLDVCSTSLASIPGLVEEKKWSKVLGVISGPMGTLGQTMDSLAAASDNKDKLLELGKKVKTDLYAIAAAVERKQGDKILEFHAKTTNDLVAYAKAL